MLSYNINQHLNVNTKAITFDVGQFLLKYIKYIILSLYLLREIYV